MNEVGLLAGKFETPCLKKKLAVAFFSSATPCPSFLPCYFLPTNWKGGGGVRTNDTQSRFLSCRAKNLLCGLFKKMYSFVSTRTESESRFLPATDSSDFTFQRNFHHARYQSYKNYKAYLKIQACFSGISSYRVRYFITSFFAVLTFVSIQSTTGDIL